MIYFLQNAAPQKTLMQFLCISLKFATTIHEAISLHSHCGFTKHWLFLWVSSAWLFMSSTGTHSILSRKDPHSKPTGGKERVWGLLGGTLCQVIPLRSAILVWIHIELLCLSKQHFIFKSTPLQKKNASKHTANGTISFV